MKLLTKPAFAFLLCGGLVVFTAFTSIPGKKKIVTPEKNEQPRIQVAILLDVSNSMDGLIDQARAELWNLIGTLGKAQCNSVTPSIEVALYEYGRSTNDVKLGYVKQISGFSNDLDNLSKNLFSLTTNGGDEYCGHVINTALNELKWDNTPNSYKVIFISGNESFLQGDVPYTIACAQAKEKGVIVNTIYCGDRAQGISEHWNLNAECGTGSFTNINQDSKIEEIPTPYDSTLFVLNDKLNNTYLAYGSGGYNYAYNQVAMDSVNTKMNKSVGLQRIAVKGNAKLYQNQSWDMVDADGKDDKFVETVDMKTLPDSLKNKTRAQLKEIVAGKAAERKEVQNQINDLNTKRELYINAEKAKRIATNNTQTLETEVDKIIRQQAKDHNMIIQ